MIGTMGPGVLGGGLRNGSSSPTKKLFSASSGRNTITLAGSAAAAAGCTVVALACKLLPKLPIAATGVAAVVRGAMRIVAIVAFGTETAVDGFVAAERTESDVGGGTGRGSSGAAVLQAVAGHLTRAVAVRRCTGRLRGAETVSGLE